MFWTATSFDDFASTATMYTLNGSGSSVPAGWTLQSTGGVLNTKCLSMAGGNGALNASMQGNSSSFDNRGTAAWFKTNVGFTTGTGFIFGTFRSSGGASAVLAIASSGGITMWDTPPGGSAVAPVVIGTFLGPAGQTVTDGKWHYIEYWLSGITTATTTMSLYVDGVLWHTATLSQGANTYVQGTIYLGNNNVSAGSTIFVDDIVVWDTAIKAFISDFNLPSPLNPGQGGMVMQHLAPTGDAAFAPAPSEFVFTGGASLNACLSPLWDGTNAPSFRGTTPASFSVPPNAPSYGGAVTFTTPTLANGPILGCMDIMGYTLPAQPSANIEFAPYVFDSSLPGFKWGTARSEFAFNSVSGVNVLFILNPLTKDTTTGLPWTKSTIASAPSQWGVYSMDSVTDTATGPLNTFAWSRSVLIAMQSPPKYVVNNITC